MRSLLRRVGHGVLLAGFVLPPLLGHLLPPALAGPTCELFHVTGYSSAAFPGFTSDGTPTRGNEWSIVAAHRRIPFDSQVAVQGVGSFRVADRGQLGWSDLDVLVYSDAEAFALTGDYLACITS